MQSLAKTFFAGESLAGHRWSQCERVDYESDPEETRNP